MCKITVIMSVFNDEKFLSYAVNSILCQTFDDFQFVICDDGSCDGSWQILEKFAQKDKRITLFRNETNMGLQFSLNKCIEKSVGEYIARMDSDDIAKAYRFERQAKFLDENAQYALCSSLTYIIDDDNKVIGQTYNGGARSLIDVYKGRNFAHPTVVMRKSALVAVGGYNQSKSVTRLEDYDLWCKFYQKNYQGFVLEERLLNYREDLSNFKKRKYKFRVQLSKNMLKWAKKFQLGFAMKLFALKPLIVGLVPSSILLKKRKKAIEIKQ
ncbi:MAG: glycosyltransferase [Clostridia bacterium]